MLRPSRLKPWRLDFRFSRGKLVRGTNWRPWRGSLKALSSVRCFFPRIREEVVDAESFYPKVSDGGPRARLDRGVLAGRFERAKAAAPQAYFVCSAHRESGDLSTFAYGQHRGRHQ